MRDCHNLAVVSTGLQRLVWNGLLVCLSGHAELNQAGTSADRFDDGAHFREMPLGDDHGVSGAIGVGRLRDDRASSDVTKQAAQLVGPDAADRGPAVLRLVGPAMGVDVAADQRLSVLDDAAAGQLAGGLVEGQEGLVPAPADFCDGLALLLGWRWVNVKRCAHDL